MPDDSSRRDKAREAIRGGHLPVQAPDRTVWHTGCGTACDVCGDRIVDYQAEFEIEFNRPGVWPGIDRYHLHAACFAAWEWERVGRGQRDTRQPPKDQF